MITVVCLRWGEKFSKDYVNILHERVKRQLDMPFQFVCVSDDTGYDDGIEVVKIPTGLEGWWGKLWLFSPEFAEHCTDRVLFLDLDTIVTGIMDDLARYDGEFIVLRDFYRPNGYGSGLMAWKKGFGHNIWNDWVAAGKPLVEGGDQAWIENCVLVADKWQDRYPGQVVSYKAHAENFIPGAAKIVCFHGKPMPHEIRGGWVPMMFRKGGAVAVKIIDGTNVAPEQMLANVAVNCGRELRQFDALESPHSGSVVIVGGAPSMANNLHHIRQRQKKGAVIWAVNGAHDALVKAGIRPDVFCVMDARKETAETFGQLVDENTTCFINAMCDPSMFERFMGRKVIMWHSYIEPEGDHAAILREKGRGNPAVMQGGNTISLNSMYLAFYLGYRKIHLYGVDSSYSGGRHHAYEQRWNDGAGVFQTFFNGKEYAVTAWMLRQVECFRDMWRQLMELGCAVTVHGDGLLPDVCRHLNSQFRQKLMESQYAKQLSHK
jgi:hypothetical protein